MPPRKLTRESVVAQAVGVADRSGIEALTMRALARDLGVEAMSLYHHVANKEQLLDAIVDRVYAEVEPPIVGGDWRAGMRARALSLRAALRRHPWALPLMESRRSPGPATLAYHEATLACLRAAAFPPRLVAHAAAVVDAFVYGFVLQETTLPFDSGEAAAAFVSCLLYTSSVYKRQLGRSPAAHSAPRRARSTTGSLTARSSTSLSLIHI